jgi:hypothetical protein
VYAIRLDFAVAANLNISGAFFRAHRVSKGYGWGYIKPDLDGDVSFERVAGFGPTAVPAIPDDDLGWEVNAGVAWALLDGLEVDLRCAYWRPGKWFSYACISRANPGWATPNAANLYGTIPNRTIDPVAALEVVVTASLRAFVSQVAATMIVSVIAPSQCLNIIGGFFERECEDKHPPLGMRSRASLYAEVSSS